MLFEPDDLVEGNEDFRATADKFLPVVFEQLRVIGNMPEEG